MSNNRIWIELEYPSDKQCKELGVEKHALGNLRALLMTNMLHRLGAGKYTRVWWHASDFCYCLTEDSAGTYHPLSDKGEWFNLDFLGRPIETEDEK